MVLGSSQGLERNDKGFIDKAMPTAELCPHAPPVLQRGSIWRQPLRNS